MRTLSCVLLCLLAARVLAHGGEDHGDVPRPAMGAVQGETHVLGATGDVFEVVLEHPRHGEGGKTPLRVFVAEVDTNAPVSGAQVELTFTGPTLQKLTPRMDSPGVYLAEAELPLSAEFAAVTTVTRGEAVDVLALGTVHLEPEEESTAASGVRSSSRWPLAVVGGLGVLGIMAWGLTRRRRRRAP